MASLDELTQALKTFAEERDWDRYHSPKNFAMALIVEAGELLDPLQWCGHEESRTLVQNEEVKAYLTKEVGDILINLLQFARWCDIDVEAAAWSKLEKLKVRYDPERLAKEGYSRVREDTGEHMFPTLTVRGEISRD